LPGLKISTFRLDKVGMSDYIYFVRKGLDMAGAEEWVSFEDSAPPKGQVILIRCEDHKDNKALNFGILFAHSNWNWSYGSGEESSFQSVSVINGNSNPGRSGCISYFKPYLTDEIFIKDLIRLNIRWRTNPIS
jgi:hypothetical protein